MTYTNIENYIMLILSYLPAWLFGGGGVVIEKWSHFSTAITPVQNKQEELF